MPASGNVGVAFALVIGAGLSTTIGACAAFFAKLASPKFLAAGLGVSAGVMLYVSFVEIFMQKGVDALVSGGWSQDNAYRWGTVLLFAGMLVTAILNCVVHVVSAYAGVNEAVDATALNEVSNTSPRTSAESKKGTRTLTAKAPVDVEAPSPPATDSGSEVSEDGCCVCKPGEHVMNLEGEVHLAHTPDDMPAEAAEIIDTYVTNDHHRFGLQKMGLMTALAIGIHNLPEGLATFVAALADPLNGVAIAVAIALHNIPEGVCVAMPVYYATGSRFKGAFISGLSEPIGGLLGYFVLYGNRMSDVAYGILFCVVAGMMVYISMKELIPTAIKYDPQNKVTSTGIIFGMAVMAVSLLLFTI